MRTTVQYRAQHEALKFLSKVLSDERGLALLHGPAASGKTVLAKRFANEVKSHIPVAIVNGARTNSTDLLRRILQQYGINASQMSAEDLVNTLNVFVSQRARQGQVPLLILENITDMFPSSLAMLSKLASLMTETQYAMRFILTSNRDMSRIISARSMASVYERVIGNFRLGPMTAKEAARYLYIKLRTGGVQRPDDVLPVDTCEKLHAMTAGWPGDLDALALSVVEQAREFPVRAADVQDPNKPVVDDSPRLIITQLGKTVQDIRVTEKRMLIGRSDLGDIVIRDQFVSNQHALLIRDRNAIVLVDLKSRNGTYVNSRRVQGKVLLHNDIVSIGDHRIKMIYAEGKRPADVDAPNLADTAKPQEHCRCPACQEAQYSDTGAAGGQESLAARTASNTQ